MKNNGYTERPYDNPLKCETSFYKKFFLSRITLITIFDFFYHRELEIKVESILYCTISNCTVIYY